MRRSAGRFCVSVSRRAFLNTCLASAASLAVGFWRTGVARAAFVLTRKYGFFMNQEGDTILKMVSTIAPHKHLEAVQRDTTLQIDRVVGEAPPETQSLYLEGIRNLNAKAKAAHGRVFVDLADKDKVALLKSIETTPFFMNVYRNTMLFFYNDHRVWKRFGYPGASFNEGGYLTRGFNKLGW